MAVKPPQCCESEREGKRERGSHTGVVFAVGVICVGAV